MAELEAAVGQSLVPVEALGSPHRTLRALRPLLFADTSALAGSPLLGALPASVALAHLFARAPPGLPSPHARSGFTPAQARAPHDCPAALGCRAAVSGGCTRSLRSAWPALAERPLRGHARAGALPLGLQPCSPCLQLQHSSCSAWPAPAERPRQGLARAGALPWGWQPYSPCLQLQQSMCSAWPALAERPLRGHARAGALPPGSATLQPCPKLQEPMRTVWPALAARPLWAHARAGVLLLVLQPCSLGCSSSPAWVRS